MRRLLVAGLVALVAACGSEDERRPLVYAAPQPPGPTEQGAIANAEATLQASLASPATTQPATGAAGLGDQLVASLGDYAASARMPDAWSAKVAGAAAREAFDTGGMDPACVTSVEDAGVTTVTWGATAPCTVHVEDVDPYSGDTLVMDVALTGTLEWRAALGRTTWRIGETVRMTMTSGGETISTAATASLEGEMTVTASTIEIGSTSRTAARTTYMGLHFDEALTTTLDASLGYQAEPFCVTSGTLTVEQRWDARPMGATPQDLPDRGWRFDWSGCGAYTVAPGL